MNLEVHQSLMPSWNPHVTDLHELNDSQLKTHLIAGLMDSYLVYTSACFRMIGEDFQELIDGSGDSEGMPTTISYVKTRTCHLMSCHSFGKKMDLMTALEKEFDLPRHSIQQLPGQKNVSNEILRFPLSIPEERNLLVPTITSLPQDVTKHIVSFLPTFTPLDKKMLCLMGKHMRLVEEFIQYLENFVDSCVGNLGKNKLPYYHIVSNASLRGICKHFNDPVLHGLLESINTDYKSEWSLVIRQSS